MSVLVRCRPIDDWNGRKTWPRDRRRNPYSVTWARSLREFGRELEYLGASDVVLGLDVQPSKIRLDGWPKADAAVPPPVVVTFTSEHGPLRYQCDRWDDWRGNLRAITLVLQRQRQVNEAGVGQADQVYRGFGALPPGDPIALGASKMTLDQAAALLAKESGDPHLSAFEILQTGGADAAYRMAVKQHHPDAGGDPEVFRRLTEARDLLLASAA